MNVKKKANPKKTNRGEKEEIVLQAHTGQREAVSKGRFKRDKKCAGGREEMVRDTKSSEEFYLVFPLLRRIFFVVLFGSR